jgi:hypothetical protein
MLGRALQVHVQGHSSWALMLLLLLLLLLLLASSLMRSVLLWR